jgi:hypothetical protein
VEDLVGVGLALGVLVNVDKAWASGPSDSLAIGFEDSTDGDYPPTMVRSAASRGEDEADEMLVMNSSSR